MLPVFLSVYTLPLPIASFFFAALKLGIFKYFFPQYMLDTNVTSFAFLIPATPPIRLGAS